MLGYVILIFHYSHIPVTPCVIFDQIRAPSGTEEKASCGCFIAVFPILYPASLLLVTCLNVSLLHLGNGSSSRSNSVDVEQI